MTQSSAVDMEREANAFAVELLMPREFLMRDLDAMGGIDIEDERKVQALAKKYRVSLTVMAARLGQLFMEE